VVERSDVGDGITHLRIRVAPEKRYRLARLAGPARLGVAAAE
jgi:GTP-binding protein HflX